jgi:hypothetical protein
VAGFDFSSVEILDSDVLVTACEPQTDCSVFCQIRSGKNSILFLLIFPMYIDGFWAIKYAKRKAKTIHYEALDYDIARQIVTGNESEKHMTIRSRPGLCAPDAND